MPVTTSESLKVNRGEMCAKCKRRVPLVAWLDGTGNLCPDCDPRQHVVTIAPDDAPITRGREAQA